VGRLACWLQALGRRYSAPVIALLTVVCLLYSFLPVSEALWAETLGVEGTVSTGEGPPPPHAGTSLEADKTATGFYENGEYGVRGDICVANVGERTTEGLAIVDQVQFKVPGHGGFQDLEGASVEIEVLAELEPGEDECYSYEIIFAPVEGAKAYRNVARVTIANHSGHMGESFGPAPKASFSLPLDQDDDSGGDDDQGEGGEDGSDEAVDEDDGGEENVGEGNDDDEGSDGDDDAVGDSNAEDGGDEGVGEGDGDEADDDEGGVD
jgi:hypothetical protein